MVDSTWRGEDISPEDGLGVTGPEVHMSKKKMQGIWRGRQLRQQQAHGTSVKLHRARTLKGMIPSSCTSSRVFLNQSHYFGVTLAAVVSLPTL